MSTTIRRRFKIDGILVDADAATLSDPTATYGVRRRDTGAVVVAAGTAMTRVSLGNYAYTFTDPEPGLDYEFYTRFEYAGEVYSFQDDIPGGGTGNLYDLLPLVAPYVAGAPEEVLRQGVRHAGREFCLLTEVWREDLDAVDSATGVEEYALTPAYDADFARIRSVTVDGIPWDYRFDMGLSTLTLHPAPGQDDLPIVASVTYTPREALEAYPAWLLGRYDQAIADGAIAYLCGMARKPWSDSAEANRRYTQYRGAIAGAKLERVRGNGLVGRQVRLPRFV